MLSSKKIRYSLATLSTAVGALFSWNSYQFLTKEPLLPLVSYSNPTAPEISSALLKQTCNSTIPYIACGFDILLLFGLLLIAILAGYTLAYTKSKKSGKPGIVNFVLFPLIAVFASFTIVTATFLITASVLFNKSQKLITEVHLDLKATKSKSNTKTYIFDSKSVQKEISAELPQLYEGMDAYAFAAISKDKAPTKNNTYPFFHAVIIPFHVYLSVYDSIPSLVPYVYLPEQKSLLVFRYEEAVLKDIFLPLSQQIVRTNFHEYTKEENPEIKILKNGDYERFENEHIQKIENEYKQALIQIDNEISSVYQYIAENNSFLTFFEGTEDYAEATQLVASYNADANNYIYELQGIKSVVEENYELFKKNPITPELQSGVFNPPNLIVIRYDNKKEDSVFPITDGLNVFIHELLHYHSYQLNDDLDGALNEGMTDYLTGKMLSKYMQGREIPPEFFGYEAEVMLIRNLTKKIPEKELTDIYFAQSNTQLEKAVTTYYPTADYPAFTSLVTSLFYLPPRDSKQKIEHLRKIETVLATDSARKLQK